MSAQNAKDAADDIVARLRLPNDAKGRKLQLVIFTSEEDCRFFYPRRALEWQRQVNTYISRSVRQRGFRVQRIALTPADYSTWMSRMKIPPEMDTAETRRTYADAFLKLLE
ncbi:MAG TPA: hypothetical protein VHW03_09970 [Chthoniobacterales bacterium]|nr:hypothetical protein [Chthoniobacterales bacterium]